jgi:hypothetical protein
MLYSRLFAAIAAGALSLAAAAAEPSSKALPSDPAAATAPLVYTSAFAGAPHAPEPQASPDKVWRQANANVAAAGMDGAMDMPAVPPGDAKPAAAAAPDHAHHHMPGMTMPPAQSAGAGHQHAPASEPTGDGK